MHDRHKVPALHPTKFGMKWNPEVRWDSEESLGGWVHAERCSKIGAPFFCNGVRYRFHGKSIPCRDFQALSIEWAAAFYGISESEASERFPNGLMPHLPDEWPKEE